MYQRSIGPQFQFGSPMAQAASSQGAGGAIPRGGAAAPAQGGSMMDMNNLGGLLGMMKNMKEDGQPQMDLGFDANAAIGSLPNLGGGMQEGATLGQTPNNLGGMPLMNLPDWMKNYSFGGM